MSADFTKILVKDDRLDVVDNIKYAVIKGGQNVTAAPFKAISTTDSQIVFNIQVPSEQTIIDRRVLLQTDLCLKVTSCLPTINATNTQVTPAVSVVGCGYGTCASLAPYPLHQLMTVASATINNNTVSINIRDVLPAIIRLLDKRELCAFNSTTVTYPDTFYSYLDQIGQNANSNGAYGSSVDTDVFTRGSIALSNYYRTGNDEYFQWKITEPLLLSPFIYCNPISNAQGFYGIQNMNFVLNIGDTSRVFRGLNAVNGFTGSQNMSANVPVANASVAAYYPSGTVFPAVGANAVASYPIISSVSAGGILANPPVAAPTTLQLFNNATLWFMFLTPHPSDLMPARNIVPYYELPRYITGNFGSVDAATGSWLALGGDAVATQNVNNVIKYAAAKTLASQTLQLNQIPDKLVLFFRKRLQDVSYGDSDSALVIEKLNINFNNNSGILASADINQLFRMCKDNGSEQNYREFRGAATVNKLPLDSAANSFNTVPTVGTYLVLEFGHDIQLIEDFFAPGSLGNFNIQVNIDVTNQSPIDVTPELVMITMNSGVFVCERGTSSTYTGILTRADVLEASEQDAYTHSDVKRMVGGGFLDRLKSGVSKLAPLVKAVAPVLAPMAKNYLKDKGAMGKLASQGLGALGAGMAGAGMSGGALKGRYM